jgi:hypothetical protein
LFLQSSGSRDKSFICHKKQPFGLTNFCDKISWLKEFEFSRRNSKYGMNGMVLLMDKKELNFCTRDKVLVILWLLDSVQEILK